MVIILKEITASNLRNLNDIKIIDIRNREKYNDNHILNAINIPYREIIINYKNYLNKSDTYYIYCQRGITSVKICNFLSSEGYNVVNIKGGYESWVLTE